MITNAYCTTSNINVLPLRGTPKSGRSYPALLPSGLVARCAPALPGCSDAPQIIRLRARDCKKSEYGIRAAGLAGSALQGAAVLGLLGDGGGTGYISGPPRAPCLGCGNLRTRRFCDIVATEAVHTAGGARGDDRPK